MKSIDYTRNKEFISFIPTHFLETEVGSDIGTWRPINSESNNFMNGGWEEYVHSIIKLNDTLVCVVFKDTYYEKSGEREMKETVLYKGTLE